jgi:hypothetical protein
MKTLYILTSNNCDGSSSVRATFDGELIKEMEKKYEEGELDSERWVDGDGFHYNTWTLPDECTPESMGLFYPLKREDVFYD